MPTSDAENKDVVIRWYNQLRPKRVLDIGAGNGTYSKLVTEKHGAAWTALEAWGPYVTRYKLHSKYNTVIVADARYVDYGLLRPDLVIAGDVLEHMAKRDAKQLINTFKHHANSIIISVPLLHLDQDAYKGNWFETHHDHWGYEEMCKFLGGGLRESIKGPTLGYFLWVK